MGTTLWRFEKGVQDKFFAGIINGGSIFIEDAVAELVGAVATTAVVRLSIFRKQFD